MAAEDVRMPPGPASDAQGRPAFDPSPNVLDLVRAESRRQDDLREAESHHVREIARLRAEHAAQLREAESKRIDAIRAVDVGAAQTLAAQVAATAEALRTQVAAAAAASVTSLAAALEPIQKDIRDLRDAQSRGQGGKDQTIETRTQTDRSLALLVGLAGVFIALLAVAASVIATR